MFAFLAERPTRPHRRVEEAVGPTRYPTTPLLQVAFAAVGHYSGTIGKRSTLNALPRRFLTRNGFWKDVAPIVVDVFFRRSRLNARCVQLDKSPTPHPFVPKKFIFETLLAERTLSQTPEKMDQASGGEDPNKPSKKKSNDDEGRNKKLVCMRSDSCRSHACAAVICHIR